MSYTESTWKTSYDLKRPRFYPSDNELIFDDESFMNNNHHQSSSPPPDSQTLQITQRKISKQKPAAGDFLSSFVCIEVLLIISL
jgi:hypothetical protein